MTQTRAAARALSAGAARKRVTRAAAAASRASADVQGSAQVRPPTHVSDEASSRGDSEEPESSADEGLPPPAATPHEPKRRRREAVVPKVPTELLCYCEGSRIHVGTSGYSYKHWRGPSGFYAGLPQHLEFERYGAQFDFLEVNNTFYRIQSQEVFDAWRERAAAVRPSFQYAVKAHRMLTHSKRLIDDETFRRWWADFWGRCERLRPHLGPILFQLPAAFKTSSGKGAAWVDNVARLRRLAAVLPAGQKLVWEFRDASWLCPEVYQVMQENDWCLAISHCTDAPDGQRLASGGWIGSLSPGPNPRPEEYPLHACSWGVYVRFHGSEGQYRGRHGRPELEQWARHAQRWAAQGRQVWLAFNNDNLPQGEALPAAVADCQELAAALRRCGAWPRL